MALAATAIVVVLLAIQFLCRADPMDLRARVRGLMYILILGIAVAAWLFAIGGVINQPSVRLGLAILSAAACVWVARNGSSWWLVLGAFFIVTGVGMATGVL